MAWCTRCSGPCTGTARARGASTSRSPSGSTSTGSSRLASKSQSGLDQQAAATARTSLCPPTSTTCSVRARPSRTS
eukprot:1276662-Rhodomonas_salina.1